MISAVDTNVLLDILCSDPHHFSSSLAALEESHRRGRLIINEVVYAELAVHFDSPTQLDDFLKDTRIELEPSHTEALAVAAEAWRAYKDGRPLGLQCPGCDTRNQVHCSNCGRYIQPRQHIMSDFLIGGHALMQAQRLITRDRGFYRRHFQRLPLIP